MAGFEVIVRPVILPNIRPAPPRILPPVPDPSQGLFVLKGGDGNFLGISSTFSVSFSQQQPHKEAVRQYDTERVYKKNDQQQGGSAREDTSNIDKNTYVDVERLRRVRLDTSDGPIKVVYNDPPEVDNVETLERDLVR
jgi:hypothetical protein